MNPQSAFRDLYGHACPFGEAQIGGDHHAGSLVKYGQQVE